MIILSYNIRGLGKRVKRRDVKDLVRGVKPDFCCLQESKLEQVNPRLIKSIWGNKDFDWDFANSAGRSGGIISIWNPTIFQKTSSWNIKEMFVINGYLIEDGRGCSIVNVYAPGTPAARGLLWDQIGILATQRKDDYFCVIGDFNCIRSIAERVGRNESWNTSDMDCFNNFIEGNNLIEVRISGRSFTLYRPDGSCKSKLDRMFVNAEWISKWPNQTLKGGRRTLSDHCPIFIEANKKDWGPKPFHFFNF